MYMETATDCNPICVHCGRIAMESTDCPDEGSVDTKCGNCGEPIRVTTVVRRRYYVAPGRNQAVG